MLAVWVWTSSLQNSEQWISVIYKPPVYAAWLCPTLQSCILQRARTPVPHHLPAFAKFTSTPLVIPASCPILWCPLSFCPQSFPALGTFPISHLLASDDQNSGDSASASILPVNIQGWSPLRLTGLISLLSKGLSGVFSSTTVQRHQFFGILPSLWSSSDNYRWPLGRP